MTLPIEFVHELDPRQSAGIRDGKSCWPEIRIDAEKQKDVSHCLLRRVCDVLKKQDLKPLSLEQGKIAREAGA